MALHSSWLLYRTDSALVASLSHSLQAVIIRRKDHGHCGSNAIVSQISMSGHLFTAHISCISWFLNPRWSIVIGGWVTVSYRLSMAATDSTSETSDCSELKYYMNIQGNALQPFEASIASYLGFVDPARTKKSRYRGVYKCGNYSSLSRFRAPSHWNV